MNYSEASASLILLIPLPASGSLAQSWPMPSAVVRQREQSWFMKKQLHVYYSGRVQGIGFRYTVREIADSLAVCGWVKNLDDGRVEVTAEADEEVLHKFIAQVNTAFNQYIQDSQLYWGPATGEFRDFNIRF